jgi:hypothetical protein
VKHFPDFFFLTTKLSLLNTNETILIPGKRQRSWDLQKFSFLHIKN